MRNLFGAAEQSILRARGPCPTWSSGPSTSPLEVGLIADPLIYRGSTVPQRRT